MNNEKIIPQLDKVATGASDLKLYDYAGKVNFNDINKPIEDAKSNLPVATPALNKDVVLTPSSLSSVNKIYIPKKETSTVSNSIISTVNPDVSLAEREATQILGATTLADKEQSALMNFAKSLFSSKTSAQNERVNIENNLGLQEQQKELNSINSAIADQKTALRAEDEAIKNIVGLTEGQLQVKKNTLLDTYGKRLSDLGIRQSAVTGNIENIQQQAERQTKLLTDGIDNQIQFLNTFGAKNVDYLTTKDNQKLGLLVNNLNNQKENIKTLQSAKANMIMELSKNGGGSSPIIQQIQNARNLDEISTLGANSGYIGKLEREDSLLDRQLKLAQIGKIRSEVAGSGTFDINQAVAGLKQVGLPSQKINEAILTNLLKTNKIGEGSKTGLSTILGVTNAIETHANKRQLTGFKGVSPLNAVLDAKIPIPFTNQSIPIPFRQSLLKKESVENKGYLDAINLKVQQWASGASLTAEQVEQVNRLVPKSTDTDKTARIKLNNLYNFMQDQTRGILTSQGIDYEPAPVNLFETRDLYNKASDEEKKQIEEMVKNNQ